MKQDMLRQLRHHGTLLITLGALLLLYILLGFLLLPWLAQRQLVNTLQERLQVNTTIGDISFNPFTFVGSMDNLHLQTADDLPLLNLQQFYFNFDPTRLFLLKVRFDELSFVSPQFYFNRFTESDNTVSRLLTRWEESATPEASGPDAGDEPAEPVSGQDLEPETELFPLEIGRFAYIDGSIHFHDEVPASDFDTVMNPINIRAENFSTIEEEVPGNNELLIELEQDARLRLSSNFIVSPLQLTGTVALENFSLLTPYRYYQDTAPFILEDGRLGISMDYDVTLPVGGINMLVDNIQVQLSELVMLENGEAPFIEGGSLTLSNGSIRYPELAVAADSLALDGATLRLVQNAQQELNWLRMLERVGDEEDESEEPDEDGDSSLQLNLAQLTISNTHIEFTDEVPARPAHFEVTLGASLQGFSLAPNGQMPFTVETVLGSGGELALQGDLRLFPDLDLSASLRVERLSLLPLQPYINEQARATISAGELNANAQLVSNSGEALSATGDISVAGLALNDQMREEPLLGWENLSFDTVAVSLSERQFTISEIIFDQLYTRVVITEDGETNIGLVLNDGTGEEVADAATTAADEVEDAADEEQQTGEAFTIAVGRVVFNDAQSDFMDQNLPIAFDAKMQDLDGELSGFSTDSSQPMQLELEGQVDEFGLVEIDGALNPLDVTSQTTINLSFTNLDLPATSPYVIKFAGREIDEGSADLDLQYRVTGGQLNASNNIVIRNMELGQHVESPNALDLPLDMAVALLESSEGIINLDIPVTGDVNDPQFSLGPIIRGAISNAIGSIVTSPFRFLGNLIGGDGEELSGIGFRPGRSDVAPPEQQKLLRLSEALVQRPQLQLQLPAPLAPEEDHRALQTSVVDARIEERLTAIVAEEATDAPAQGEPASGQPAASDASQQRAQEAAPQFSDRRLQVLEQLYTEAQLTPTLEELRPQFTAMPESTQPAPDNEQAGADADGEADSDTEASLLAILSFDLLSYSAHLRDALIAAENISEQQLQMLAQARQQAAIDFLQANTALDAARLQKGDIAQAETVDGWVRMEFELGSL